ncbi:MAG: DUF167 domain-containing protein [Abditibacteriota bacterium]|nr:DUF167 domain-containing protein [Abditibacteriota bacterium]
MIIQVRLSPRGSKNMFQELKGEVFCIKLTAPPVEGAANQALVKFLSDRLEVNKSRIRLVSGHKSRDKKLEIDGLTFEEIKARLEAAK